jgi:hypothetical protein
MLVWYYLARACHAKQLWLFCQILLLPMKPNVEICMLAYTQAGDHQNLHLSGEEDQSHNDVKA